MVIANFTPSEVCTYLKFCSDSSSKPYGLIGIEVDSGIGKLIIFINRMLMCQLIFIFVGSNEELENGVECKVCVKVLDIVESHLINKKKTKVRF